MSQLLPVSRAARLIGVSRNALQKKIRGGELATFEGKIKVTDLLRAYPETSLENNTMLERVERIKAEATPKTSQERNDRETGLPDARILFNRLELLSREWVESKNQLNAHAEFKTALLQRLDELNRCPDEKLRPELETLTAWTREQFDKQAELPESKAQLLVRDTFLRLMAAHVKIIPSGHEFFVEGSGSLLEAALHAGLALNYGCSSGNCGACKARVISGEVWKIRDHDYVLSEAEKNLGYMLMCSNTAITDLVVEAAEATSVRDLPLQQIPARLRSLEYSSPDLGLLHVQTPRTQTLRFMAGQYVTLSLESGEAANHYVASCPCDGRNLIFHIPRHAGDQFASAVFKGLESGTPITVTGPHGEFVLQEDATEPALMLAHTDGFAPIKSLLEHAVSMDAAESIHFYWLATGDGGHYLNNVGRAWTDALDNFSYTPLQLENTSPEALRAALESLFDSHESLGTHRIYLAGPRTFLDTAREVLKRREFPADRIHLTPVPAPAVGEES